MISDFYFIGCVLVLLVETVPVGMLVHKSMSVFPDNQIYHLHSIYRLQRSWNYISSFPLNSYLKLILYF